MSDRSLPNWLEAYLAYSAENESPEVFHLFVGLSTIASTLRRRVYFDHGYFLVYPNLYVALVGPAGRVKKTTAIKIGSGLLKAAVHDVKISADSTSREKLIDNMSRAFKDGQSALTATASEFGSLLTTSGVDMIVFLTDIFDCPIIWSHDTRGSSLSEIKAPVLNLLAGATPDWISKGMPIDTVGIGLTSRTLFVYEDTPRAAKPIPRLTTAQQALETLLRHDLTQISHINGEYKFSNEEAAKWHTDWYLSRFGRPVGDPRLAGYFERKPLHLIKIAICVAASKRDERTIEVEDMEAALSILDRIEERMIRVFQGVGKNPLAADTEDAMATLIATAGGFSFGEMLDRFKHSVRKEELAEILDSLILMRKVKLVNGRYYSTHNNSDKGET